MGQRRSGERHLAAHDLDGLAELLQRPGRSGGRRTPARRHLPCWTWPNTIRCLRDTVVMETGGMKGRRAEPVREEVHAC